MRITLDRILDAIIMGLNLKGQNEFIDDLESVERAKSDLEQRIQCSVLCSSIRTVDNRGSRPCHGETIDWRPNPAKLQVNDKRLEQRQTMIRKKSVTSISSELVNEN